MLGKYFEVVCFSEGVWVLSIWYYVGKFWIFYFDLDFGIYVIMVKDFVGFWMELYLLFGGKGLIDLCLLWDDDGCVWLVYGWVKSCVGFGNCFIVWEIFIDGWSLFDEGVVVVDGDKFLGYCILEGLKFYKCDGWYYIFVLVGGVCEGW